MEKLFKPIKGIPEFSHYEMSQDGLVVRHMRTLAAAPLIPGTRMKAELLADDNTTKKHHGLKTLYWSSWNKPFPEGNIPNHVKPKEAPKVAKSIGGSYKASDKQLMSSHARGQLINLIEKRLRMKSTAVGQEIYEGTNTTIRVLVHNTAKQKLLLRVYAQNWRDGFWFFEPDTGSFLPFKAAEHKPGHGDHCIRWP
jgi:hypothetical protein